MAWFLQNGAGVLLDTAAQLFICKKYANVFQKGVWVDFLCLDRALGRSAGVSSAVSYFWFRFREPLRFLEVKVALPIVQCGGAKESLQVCWKARQNDRS